MAVSCRSFTSVLRTASRPMAAMHVRCLAFESGRSVSSPTIGAHGYAPVLFCSILSILLYRSSGKSDL